MFSVWTNACASRFSKQELAWLESVYTSPEDVIKLNAKKVELDEEIREWLVDFDQRLLELDKRLDDSEEDEYQNMTRICI